MQTIRQNGCAPATGVDPPVFERFRILGPGPGDMRTLPDTPMTTPCGLSYPSTENVLS